ncbi:MAG: response regulator [Alphaproteobacteria bacterium]|nr:response regulator [Alphaproteobacteria bacterium]
MASASDIMPEIRTENNVVHIAENAEPENATAKELREARDTAKKAQKKAEELAQLSLYDPSPLIRFDIDHRKLLYVNPAAFNRYSDIFQKGVDHPLLADITEIALRAFSQRRTVTREVAVGSITYQQSITPNLLGDERIVTLYNHDITRLKQTEEVLRQETERAEAASRAKSDFLANVSHELRTPMNGVLGMASLLRDSALDTEQRELVDVIVQSGESLMLLLNDVLDLSKIEANELTLEQIPFSLVAMMADVVRLFEPSARQKKLDFSFFYSAVAPECLVGDPARIRQIVTNLVGNALKFTEQGGVKIDISSRRRDDGKVDMIFRVEDTGIGIEEKNINRIFSKFTQADNSTTRKYGGTGLGLTICKLLTEAMDGALGVESRVGKGSCFWFSLPLSVADAEQTRRLSAENTDKANVLDGNDFSPYRILIVDDHPINLFFARKLLMKMGFKSIDTVEDGRMALEKSAAEKYDLIILDCQMPGMDGYDVSRAIRAREDGSGTRIPIVAMTANAMIGDREKCVAAGMDDYVSKPITMPRMLEVLMKWLKAGGGGALKPLAAATAVAASPAPVDLAHLRDYIGDDEEEKQIVVSMFMSGAEEVLALMEASMVTVDNESWKKAAHKLKGSAANFGARTLQVLCGQAEQDAEADAATKQDLIRRVALACEDVRRFMGS